MPIEEGLKVASRLLLREALEEIRRDGLALAGQSPHDVIEVALAGGGLSDHLVELEQHDGRLGPGISVDRRGA
jgi:hypothetical protein